MKLRGAMLFVKDLHRMKRFYGEMLGLEPEYRGSEEWAVFDSGGIQFCLHAIPTALAQEIDIATPPELREEVAVKLMFEVNDLES